MKLRFLADGDDRVVALEGDEVRIGRGSDNDIVLADYSVSRKHAAVRREGDAWFVYDLMSTNGVQVNRVTVKKAPLKDSDRLKIGIFEFAVEGDSTVDLVPPAASVMPPPPGAHPGASISSATIIRRLSDFSADYGLEPQVPRESAVRQSKRRVLEQAYANKLFGILTRLARMLINAVSVDEVLQKVMEIAFEALPVDRGFMLLTDETSGETVCELARFSDRVELRPDADAPISKTMLETVMRERVALLTYDALADQRLVGGDSIRIHQIRSAMCAPLWSGEKIIGVMQVDSPFHAGTFNEDDLDLLTALSNYAAVAVERIRYGLRAEYDRQVRSRLERYHSPAVIEAVLSEGESEEEGVRLLKNAEATVLFADLVGFTALAEELEPQAVAELLGGYFTHSAEAIFAEGGTLDKFIGDCVMAFFGAPVAQADHALRGVRAAARIQRSVATWNAGRESNGLPLVKCRIGLNSGPVVVGDVGSNRRVDYTVLGNTVNVASRLEAVVATPGNIAIGKTTFDLLAGAVPVEPLGEIQLKGLQRLEPTYRVLWEELEDTWWLL